MPSPALPEQEPTGTGGVNFSRSFTDPLGRPYSGRVTVRRLSPPPFVSVQADLDASGTVSMRLEPGRYAVGAMLRDPDGTRAYIAEDIDVTQEDS